MNDLETLANTHWDAVIIGSGIGGMTTASLLSQVEKKKVLLVERHFQLGGFTHSFKRKEFSWDSGLHYVGQMAETDFTRKVMDFITAGQVQWQKMLDPFEIYHFPGFQFKQFSDPAKFESDLKAAFPEEKETIEKYFSDLKEMQVWRSRFFMAKEMPSWIQHFFEWLTPRAKHIARLTMNQYFEEIGIGPQLKAVLLAQWGDYGLPPSQASAIIHMLIVSHYLEGAYYPQGGAAKIPTAIQKVIEDNGGAILLGCEAKKIIVENQKATGVLLKHLKQEKEVQIKADQFFSDIGAIQTYKRLFPVEVAQDFSADLEKVCPGHSVLTLFIGFKESPKALGFRGENHWIFETIDHDQAFEQSKDLMDGKVWSGYLSFPSLKDDKHEGKHTAELITKIPYELFLDWKDSKWLKRGDEYQQLKSKLTETLLSFLEKKFPGFSELVSFTELSTPLTYEAMTFHEQGEIYSIPPTVERFLGMKWLGVRTPVSNVYITGTDASSHGIVGAMMGGFVSAALSSGIMGFYKMGKAVSQN